MAARLRRSRSAPRLISSGMGGLMRFVFNDYEYELTTEHAASSYGVPVVVHGNQAYGAHDTLPHGELALDAVRRLDGALAKKFIQSSPISQISI